MDRQIMNGGRLARQRIVRIPGHVDRFKTRVLGIIEQQTASQALTRARDFFQDFRGHQRADNTSHSAEYANF